MSDNKKTATRRPRRKYEDELDQDRQITGGIMGAVLGLERRYIDIAEFTVVRRMLGDAISEFARRIKACEEAAQSTPTASPIAEQTATVPTAEPSVPLPAAVEPVDVTLGLDSF